MHVGDAAPYVAGAYVVVFVALLAYMWLIASKLGRLEDRLDELNAEDRSSDQDRAAVDDALAPDRGAHPSGGDHEQMADAARSEAP